MLTYLGQRRSMVTCGFLTKVKFAFYEEGVEVMTLIFNGIGTNKNKNNDRIIQTPYPDMLTSSFNYFGIDPSVGRGCLGIGQCRMWYISKNHGGCAADAGWVVVTTLRTCTWERAGIAPQFLYSTKSGVTNWHRDSPVGSASVMAISIQTGVL